MLQRNFTFREDPSRIKLTKVPLLQQWGNNLFFHFFQKTGVYFSLLLSYLSPSLHRSIKDIKFKEPKFNPHDGLGPVPQTKISLLGTLKRYLLFSSSSGNQWYISPRPVTFQDTPLAPSCRILRICISK